MSETYHSPDDRGLAIIYVLRILTLDQARQFESHFAVCDLCAARLRELTNFFELLRKAINRGPALQKEAIAGMDVNDTFSYSNAQSDPPELPSSIDTEKLVSIFANCFAGFQKLRKNMANRLGPKIEMAEVDKAAIEILLALPNQVSKIDSGK